MVMWFLSLLGEMGGSNGRSPCQGLGGDAASEPRRERATSRFLLPPGSEELGERLTRTASLVYGSSGDRLESSRLTPRISGNLSTRDEPSRDVCKAASAKASILKMAQPVHKTVTLVCCSSSQASWSQTVARDDVELVTSTPETLMQKLDASKEQPVVVLADQDSYDAAATACRTASSDDRCVLGAIRVANPTTALIEVDQALKQARSRAAG